MPYHRGRAFLILTMRGRIGMTHIITKKWLATDLIADEVEGKQTWIGRVIEKKGHYIRFEDRSSHERINMLDKKLVDNLELGDYLAVEVNAINSPDGKRRVKIMQIMKLNPVK